ncbi:carbohydrate ABC transporter permease [Bacillus sp. AFS037270]|uniref:carbohydrate ABC transporter permease n=1 Tax=Bacillus sp. AFS037270 TaxID=2033499 RepID=UPI000BFE0E66|nr:carbohydrate ABC transporter permease [Bacillus sp. AFS037270]PGV53408.1 sugar ABC transporter permease [Bacillus sp. AFS037270]
MTNTIKRSPVYILALGIIVFQLAPFLWQVITSLKLDKDLSSLPPIFPNKITWLHYQNIFQNTHFYKYIFNSAVVAVSVTLLCLFLGSLAAYSLARLPIKGKGLILLLFLSTSMFPQIAVITPLYNLIKGIGLYNTYFGLILSYMLFGLPLSVLLLYGFFRNIPYEIEEAAYMDGCGYFRTYWQVCLPLMAPGLVTAGLLVFIASWNEFLFAITFTNSIEAQTIPVGIAMMPQMFFVPWGDTAATSILVTLPLILLVLIFEKKLTQGIMGGAVKG